MVVTGSMQGAEVMQWRTQQRQDHPKVQASKQGKQASKTSKQGKIGESEWGGVVLVAKGLGMVLYRPRLEGLPRFGMCMARASTWVSLGVEGNQDKWGWSKHGLLSVLSKSLS